MKDLKMHNQTCEEMRCFVKINISETVLCKGSLMNSRETAENYYFLMCTERADAGYINRGSYWKK